MDSILIFILFLCKFSLLWESGDELRQMNEQWAGDESLQVIISEDAWDKPRTNDKDVKFYGFIKAVLFPLLASKLRNLRHCHLSRKPWKQVLCKKAIKRRWKAGKCEIQWMKFLYFYEQHHDIFEIQFGTCSIVSWQRAELFFVSFVADILFRDPDGSFFSSSFASRLVFISLLAAWNKKKSNREL